MLGTAGARLEEELRQLKLESERLSDQLLETNGLLEYAGNQREFCRRQVEIMKKKLAEVTKVAETKTGEFIALVDERECLARDFENADIDIRKLIQKRLEAIKAQSPFSLPPNFYELLFLPLGATTSTIQKHFKRSQCSVIRTWVVGRTCSKFCLSLISSTLSHLLNLVVF